MRTYGASFQTLNLNLTNRSGVLTGRIIGQANQKVNGRLTTQNNKQVLARWIEYICRLAGKITVTNEDAVTYIDDCFPSLPKDTFVYFDLQYLTREPNLYLSVYDASNYEAVGKNMQSNASHP